MQYICCKLQLGKASIIPVASGFCSRSLTFRCIQTQGQTQCRFHGATSVLHQTHVSFVNLGHTCHLDYDPASPWLAGQEANHTHQSFGVLDRHIKKPQQCSCTHQGTNIAIMRCDHPESSKPRSNAIKWDAPWMGVCSAPEGNMLSRSSSR